MPDGNAYVDCDSALNALEILDQALADSTPTTRSTSSCRPGANVVGDLDKMAEKYGFEKGESYHNVSMGQGQDIVAMAGLERRTATGTGSSSTTCT